MNDWNQDDNSGGAPENTPENTPDTPQAPPTQQPSAPDPADFGGPLDDYADDNVKLGGGNKGMLIVVLVFIVLAGVIGFLWYTDQQETSTWQTKYDAAFDLASDAEFNATMRDILENCPKAVLRADAAYQLGEVKDEGSVSALIKAVPEGGDLGEQAALALGKINTPDAKGGADAIVAQMNEAEDLRRAKYAWALVSLGDDRGFPPLLEGISSQIVNTKTIENFDPEVVAAMATTDKLIGFADSSEPMLRMYAAMELGFRDDADPVPALLTLLNDDNEDVAREAAVSLGRTADERAGRALQEKISSSPEMLGPILTSVTQSVGAPGLEAIYRSTNDASIKYQIVGKLKQLKDPRSVELLLDITEEEFSAGDEKTMSEGKEIRTQALWTLESLGDPRVADKMLEKLRWEPISPEQIPDDAVRYRQDDMSRKIANGVLSWFGEVQPEGTADYLEQVYKENEPYANTPECAKRVKVDIGPLMDAMGRTGDQRFCSIIRPYLTKDDNFYSQAASMALGRLQCSGIADEFKKKMVMTPTERKEEKFSTLIEGRDWQMEGRLQERRNSIIASRYLGDPSLAETLMDIAMDPMDDPELRTEAANSLAYVADEAAMESIVERVLDDSLDAVARSALIKGLWHKPSATAVEAMMKILEGTGNRKFIRPAAIVVGEAGDPAYEERLNQLLDHEDEVRRRGAVMAILLGGNLDRLDRILEILAEQESSLVLRDWYESHDVYLTEDIFDSKRVYKRLRIADEIARKTENDANILWPWKHLMGRLEKGWDTSPGGMTALQVRQRLAEDVRTDPDNAQLAAEILRGLNERGFLLALQAGDGPGAQVARRIVSAMNKSTR